MHRFLSLVVLGSAGLIAGAAVQAQDKPAAKPPPPKPPATEKKTEAPSREEREKRFADSLTGVVLRGTFQVTNADGLEGKAPLTPPRPERYEIDKVAKGADDNWIITARIQYADRDVRVPVPVRVLWAGDTPVITLDTINIPMIGAYSARVVIDGHFYAGTWSGASYGGVLSGQIIKKADEPAIIEQEKKGFDMRMPKKSDAPSEAPASDTTD